MQNVFEDFQTLKEIYIKRKSSISGYEDSFYSIAQGIRHAPYLFKDNLFFTLLQGRDEVIIYNRVERSLPRLLTDVRELLLVSGRTKAIYKNVKPEEEGQLLSMGFRQYSENEFWTSDARFDDQTFPQVLVNTQELMMLKGSKFKRLRNYYNNLRDQGYCLERYVSLKHHADCVNILMSNAEEINSGSYGSQEVFDANSIFLKYPPKHTFVILRNEQVCGLIGVDVFDSMAFLNCLQAKENNIGVYAIIEVCNHLVEAGVMFLNLSGSETEGVFKWKMKFQPVKLLRRTHLVYEMGT